MSEVDWVRMFTASDDGYTLGEPVASGVLEHAERVLGVSLPDGLRSLYLATDGILDKPGEWHVIWPITRVISDNVSAYELEGPSRREFLGFGDDGTGNPFCVHRCDGDTIYYWDPIDGKSTWLAASLPDFWAGWVEHVLPPH